jgi:hypothetical protein
MGGNTVRVLQYLMETGHFNEAASKCPAAAAAAAALRNADNACASTPVASSSSSLSSLSSSSSSDISGGNGRREDRWRNVPPARPSACWVKSLTCISTPLNGTVFPYFLGLLRRTDTSNPGDVRVRWGTLAHIFMALIRLACYFPCFLRVFGVDLMWDHWDARRRREGLRGLLRTVFLGRDIWLRMHACCIGDLSIDAAVRACDPLSTACLAFEECSCVFIARPAHVLQVVVY